MQPKTPSQTHAECVKLQNLIERLREENRRRLLEPTDIVTLEDNLATLKKTIILQSLGRRLEKML